MPVEAAGADRGARKHFSRLEACGRTLAGIAPWLEIYGLQGEEASLQKDARHLAQATVSSIADPKSPDFVNFASHPQPLVDAAFLAQGFLRAPKILWSELSRTNKINILNALALTRKITPGFNNWLLFSAMIEAFFCKVGAPFDSMRIDYAIRQFDQWYVGDGLYSDGPVFHLDYYNSFVIHPFLIDILMATRRTGIWNLFHARVMERAQRYAVLLERMVSPEGTMPVTGRSLSYRCGNLHILAQLALLGEIPSSLEPSGVRAAMSAVIARSLKSGKNFDEAGWLRIGYCGHQPSLAEGYISTGSLYLCCLAFLPLGLAPENDFWIKPESPFTSQRLYSGEDVARDIALS